MSHPAISSGLASRPMASDFVAAGAVAFEAGAFRALAAIPAAVMTSISALKPSISKRNVPLAPSACAIGPNGGGLLRHLDILDLAVLVHVPRLDTVVVIDRIHAAEFAKLGLARLHVAGLVNG